MSITVAIPSYCYGHLVGHAIESVLGQTVSPDRIWVVDDGAGDCGWVQDIYPEIDFTGRRGRMGIVDNFNDILQCVSTDKMLMLGADNWLRPDAIETLDRVDADIVSYDAYVTGELLTQGHDVLAEQLFMRNDTEAESGYTRLKFRIGDIEEYNYIHGSSMFNVAMAQRHGYRRNPCGRNSDEDWMLFRAMLGDGARHIHLPVPLLYYRKHRENYNQ